MNAPLPSLRSAISPLVGSSRRKGVVATGAASARSPPRQARESKGERERGEREIERARETKRARDRRRIRDSERERGRGGGQIKG